MAKNKPERLNATPHLPVVQPSGILLPAEAETYRASMQAELQKFGREAESLQLALFDKLKGQGVEIKAAGLDLSVSEDKALSAVQKLLDKTNYKGNEPGTEITAGSSSFNWKGFIPRLSFTWTEYFEAYGLDEYQQKGRMRDEARRALLEGLTKQRPVCYERKRHEGAGQSRRTVVDIIRTATPLVRFCEYFEGLTEQEASRVEAGEPMTERVTRLVVEVSPLLMDGIENFFLLKPVSLHQEIAALAPGRPVRRAVSLFVGWLLTLNMPIMQIHKDNLATKLRLSRLVKQRKRTMLEDIIQECLETAETLGYLLSHSIEAGGLLILRLNSDKCSRVKKPKAEAADETHSDKPE